MQDAVSREIVDSPPFAQALSPFDYTPRTRVVFGRGTVARLGELAGELGGKRILVVTDKGLREAGHLQKGLDSLTDAGLQVTVFDETNPNPTTEDVERGLAVAKEANVDLIIGLGGGSSMDCAKGVNFLLTNGGKMEDYWGIGKATQPMLPMIAVPTTAGTGSEAQSFALIANAETHMKMACGDKKAACAVAILDPELTASMPDPVRMATGIDAVSHAVESFVTKPRNPVSSLFSRRAWQLLILGFPQLADSKHQTEARSRMLLGSYFAGSAIENSMLGATHALANPLTAHYGTTHGIAIGVMLPHVIRYNAKDEGIRPLYHRLAADAGLCNRPNDPEAVDRLSVHLQQLFTAAGCPTNLDSLGVERDLIPTLAGEAAKQWTGNFNPRPVDAHSLQELYECAYSN